MYRHRIQREERRVGGGKIDFDTAIDLVRSHASPCASVEIDLSDAVGRVTATPVQALIDYPRFDMSAMDGIALSLMGRAGPHANTSFRLPIDGESRAGHRPAPIAAGSACRISTGAAIPAGCDTVVPRERLYFDGHQVTIASPPSIGANIRRRGEDAMAGETVLDAGRLITPEIVGALACFGVRKVVVGAMPTIALFSLGDELLAAGVAQGGCHIFDANAPMLAAAAQALGVPVRACTTIQDDAEMLRHNLANIVRTPGVISISTGGVSVGDHDHVRKAIEAIGGKVHFHGVAMRPGKPVLFATLPNGNLFFGLPGNPVSATIAFRFFVVEAIRAMLGVGRERGQIVGDHAPSKPGLTFFLKSRRSAPDHGEVVVEPLADQRSHTMRPLIDANCWLVVDDTLGAPRAKVFDLRASLSH
jgi:molybdopterin molybdotransferase